MPPKGWVCVTIPEQLLAELRSIGATEPECSDRAAIENVLRRAKVRA